MVAVVLYHRDTVLRAPVNFIGSTIGSAPVSFVTAAIYCRRSLAVRPRTIVICVVSPVGIFSAPTVCWRFSNCTYAGFGAALSRHFITQIIWTRLCGTLVRYFLLGRNILSGFMISLKCSVSAVRHIFINRADSPAIFSNPDFMIRPIKPGQTGAGRVTIRSFIVHQRVATAFEAWRLVGFSERI